MELPELFMEFIASMTGKSPSTTGAGSEGALTKGPFNALPPIVDLNNALVSCLLTGQSAYLTSAGYVGPRIRVDHDVSLLVPEIWCRMTPEEQNASYLIREGCLERCEDFQHKGQTVFASRLGYRITRRFVRTFFGRMFNHPHVVFPEEMLRPEVQDPDIFADALDNIVSTQRRVAVNYFEDGSIDAACPPLKALLHIMRDNEYRGQGLQDPEIRRLFTRDYLLSSDWYLDRLRTKQQVDSKLWQRHIDYLERFLRKTNYADEAARLQISSRLRRVKQSLAEVAKESYLKRLEGTIGADPYVATPRRRVTLPAARHRTAPFKSGNGSPRLRSVRRV
jgi:hypothetical protein